MSGIIGRFYSILGIPTIGEDSYLSYVHATKVTLVVYHLVHVDLDECQYIMNIKEIYKYILISDKGEKSS